MSKVNTGMGKNTQRTHLAVAAAALLLVGGAMVNVAAAPTQHNESVRVTSVGAHAGAASKTTQSAPARDVLADRLGAKAATTPAETTNVDATPFAQELPLRDAAARAYEDTRVALYRAVDESVAFAILRLSKPEAARPGPIETGWETDDTTAFYSGPYVAFVSGPAASREAVASALAARIGAPAPSAPLIGHLPTASRVAGSEHFVPTFASLAKLRPEINADIFELDAGGASASVADYTQPDGAALKLTLAEYETPQLATVAERHLRAWYDALAPDAKAHATIKREGNYLVLASNVTDVATAQVTVDAVDYAYSVDWLKKPLRPAAGFDARAEGRKVAQVLISSFAIVGLGLLAAAGGGIIFGASIFRLRRRHTGSAYSDAGGMVCLDLDPALPPTAGTVRLLNAKPSESD